MILTIAGTPGSGKSTVAKILEKRLGFRRYYMGQIFRDLAKKRGLRIQDYVKLGEEDENIDREVDLYQKRIAEKEDDIILEGRTSFIMAPQSRKIFITCDLDTGVKRVFQHLSGGTEKRNEGSYMSWRELKPEILKRMETDRKRYMKYYGVDAFDPKNFDIVIDSSKITAEEVAEMILRQLQKA